MILVVNSCIRGAQSATWRYCKAYLDTLPADRLEVLELERMALCPLDRAALEARDALCRAGAFEDASFRLARQFRDAEEIVIAAPYWDLSFPSRLRVYLEQIMVAGLTFHYRADGRPEGHCRAERLHYFSTCGGFVGERHLGFCYVRELAATMLGIPESILHMVEGLDIDPMRREAILAAHLHDFD